MVNLASNLLPPVPEAEPAGGAAGRSSSAARGAADRGEAAAAENAARVSFLAENPALLQSFAQSLLPLMLQVHRLGCWSCSGFVAADTASVAVTLCWRSLRALGFGL